MKDALDRMDAKEVVFAENVKAKFGEQKLMYLRVTGNDIRYYAYGHFGYLYDTYKFNRAQTFNPEDMYQVIDIDKLKDLNPDLLIVQADYSTYMPGFGIVSQKTIMNQILDEWGLK